MFSYIDIDIYHETVPTPFHTAFWLLQSLYCWRPFLDSLTQYSNPLPPAPSALKSQMSCHLPNLIFRPGPPYHSPISAFLLCWRGLYFLSLVFFFLTTFLTVVTWNLKVGLICISLMTKGVEHFFNFLFIHWQIFTSVYKNSLDIFESPLTFYTPPPPLLKYSLAISISSFDN